MRRILLTLVLGMVVLIVAVSPALAQIVDGVLVRDLPQEACNAALQEQSAHVKIGGADCELRVRPHLP